MHRSLAETSALMDRRRVLQVISTSAVAALLNPSIDSVSPSCNAREYDTWMHEASDLEDAAFLAAGGVVGDSLDLDGSILPADLRKSPPPTPSEAAHPLALWRKAMSVYGRVLRSRPHDEVAEVSVRAALRCCADYRSLLDRLGFTAPRDSGLG
jgi:hypothetical protein